MRLRWDSILLNEASGFVCQTCLQASKRSREAFSGGLDFGDPGNLHTEAALWQSVVTGFNDMVLGVGRWMYHLPPSPSSMFSMFATRRQSPLASML